MNKKQKTKLNKLLREAMIRRDGEICLKCGTTKYIQMSHIKSRGKYRKLAFDVDNVIPLCVKHHLYWWHKEPLEAAEWIKTAIPEERLERLITKAKQIQSVNIDYETIKSELEK